MAVGLWFWSDYRNEKPRIAKLTLFEAFPPRFYFSSACCLHPMDFPAKSNLLRILTWISAFETFLHYPLTGRGLGLDAAAVFYTSVNGRQFLFDAHQLWLNIAAQQGLAGLISIIFLTVWFFKRSLSLDVRGAPLKTALGIGFITAFVYQGLGGSFEDARHLWVLLGILGSITDEKREAA